MSDDANLNPHRILPVGTQVVANVEVKGTDGRPVHPRGAVGVIIQAPSDYWHSYRVRFPDGFEGTFKRQELSILSEFKNATHPLREYNLHEHVIYRCVVGSRAYGLDNDESDTDRRGIYLPPAEVHWSLWGVPEQLENHDTQETYWEIQKFLTLAIKANPNVLECLYTPLVEYATDLAREILAMRGKFLSKMVYQTYNGYVMSQFKKLQADLRIRGEVKWKHVMHLLRLLLSGVTVLKEGFVPVRVEEHRENLLSIKRGEVPFDEVEKWRLELHRQFDEAFESTTLPERPDYESANDLLLWARGLAAPLAGRVEVLTSPGRARQAGPLNVGDDTDLRLRKIVDEQPFPLIFASISGAHLYGFPSPDSDYDLRGVHVLPIRDVVGLDVGQETIEVAGVHEGLEMDLVTHDLKKFIGLMLKKNGYVLEQLYSPLVVHTTAEHEELKRLGHGCVTKHHAHHYFGFGETQWKLFEKESPRRVKPLLYIYRVLLTGIHLMKTAETEANLLKLNETYRLPYIDELVERKLAGPEQSVLPDADLSFHRSEYDRLRGELQKAFEASVLPETARTHDGLNELLIRVRTSQLGQRGSLS